LSNEFISISSTTFEASPLAESEPNFVLYNTYEKDYVYNYYILAHDLTAHGWDWATLASLFEEMEELLKSKVKTNLLAQAKEKED